MDQQHILPETEEELMPLIIQIVPRFKDRWNKHVEWWHGEPGGIYNDISEFAHYVVDSHDKKDISWYTVFFNLIERLLTSGNKHMQELAVIGFLEDIQTISSWRPHKGKVFIKYLGLKSNKAWNDLDKLWAKHGSLANIIIAEKDRDK